MTNRQGQYLVGIDIGAGSGAKLGLFASETEQIAEAILPIERYGASADAFADSLADAVARLLQENSARREALLALGVATPGLLRSDGSIRSVSNVRFLAGANLSALLTQRLGVPVRTVNDADAGALAEWSRRRVELLYWVLGGGWGGAWVSPQGHVRFPAVDWDGQDAGLHYTNEPGYAIPLGKAEINRAFAPFGRCFSEWEEFGLRALNLSDHQLVGPCGRRDCVRAELFVSGPGRWRIFRYLAGDLASFTPALSAERIGRLFSQATAGPVLDELARLKFPVMVQTDTILGVLLAEAALALFRQAIPQGCRPDIPVFMGGKPSRALPFFGSAALQRLRDGGIASSIGLSCFDEENKNANLFGAAFAAKAVAQ
ncbi:MAG: ROK family protein [Verrucomicrobiota bacterium]|nr:ROK family protein [Verrucomicrobiota bacterium]